MQAIIGYLIQTLGSDVVETWEDGRVYVPFFFKKKHALTCTPPLQRCKKPLNIHKNFLPPPRLLFYDKKEKNSMRMPSDELVVQYENCGNNWTLR